MNISFDGIGQRMVTFASDGAVANGEPVKISANGTVKACASGDALAGIAGNVASDGAVNVIMAGFVTAAYTGTAPVLGVTALGGNGAGGVVTNANGLKVTVANVDTGSKTVGFFM